MHVSSAFLFIFCYFYSDVKNGAKWDALQTGIKRHGENLKSSLLGQGVLIYNVFYFHIPTVKISRNRSAYDGFNDCVGNVWHHTQAISLH